LRLTHITVTPGLVTLGWSAELGRNYRIEYKDDLSSNTWLPLNDPIPATTNNMSFDDTVPSDTHRFYRILRAK